MHDARCASVLETLQRQSHSPGGVWLAIIEGESCSARMIQRDEALQLLRDNGTSESCSLEQRLSVLPYYRRPVLLVVDTTRLFYANLDAEEPN